MNRDEWKIRTDKKGRQFVACSFRCPVELYERIDHEMSQTLDSLNKVVVRQMKRAYGVK